MTAPQFGVREPGRTYPDRAVAFAIVERDGRVLVVEVDSGRRGRVIDLPGGGLDPGESAREAAIRECREEAGAEVDLEAEPFALADHFFINDVGKDNNSRGAFFAGRLLGQDLADKSEADHTPLWMEPLEALIALDRDAHAWALACWLRLRARR